MSELKTDLLELDRRGQALPLRLAAVVPLGNLTLWVQVSHGKASYSVCHRALRKNVINPTKQSTTTLHRAGDQQRLALTSCLPMLHIMALRVKSSVNICTMSK